MGRHALLSASSSKRWLNCTPSARLEEQFAEETGNSVYAEEGTATHWTMLWGMFRSRWRCFLISGV